jgi:two-component system phosphate regulon sensor histidine kinase PhoR
MVEQILEFAGARSGRKKYDLREIDAKNLIENALKDCRSLIEEKGFTVERDVAENLPKITADANALSQAIQNLIINSIKYAGGEKWLKVSAKNGDGNIKITVEDKGIGISKREIAQIFQPFYRSKSVVDAQIHGNGLGLSLVKQTVEAQGGRVSVESEIGRGSRFTIHLPSNI